MFQAEIWERRCPIVRPKKSIFSLLLLEVMTILVKRIHVLSTLKGKLRVKNKPDK